MMRVWLSAALVMLSTSSAQACSEETACTVGDRDYFIALPEDTAPQGAVIYLHGWGGSGKGALRNKRMVNGFLERGFAVIAPDGPPRHERSGRSWRFHPRSNQMDDVSFLAAVKEDAVARHILDPDRFILGGFSIGGSMTAYTACLRPESFSAFVPIGGNFWRPHPEACAGPVRMMHTHGWTDTTVPLEGRVVNNLPITDPDAFVQGDIFEAMQIWRETNGCVHLRADRFIVEGRYMRRAWDRCDPGTALELAIFPGGHTVPDDWPNLVIDWFNEQ